MSSSSTPIPIPRRWPSSGPGRNRWASASSRPILNATTPAPASGSFCPIPARRARSAIGRAVCSRVREAGGTVVVAADLLALVLLDAPGAWGADIVVGSTQRFGVPDGIRGAARRLPRHPDVLRPIPAGAARRRQHRQQRPAGAAPGPPDQGAAHPPGAGDEQHLHGPGPLGGDGRSLRRVARPGRTEAHRPPRPPVDLDPGRRPPGRGDRGGQHDVVRHPHGARPGPSRRRPRRRPGGRAQPERARRRRHRRQRGRDDHGRNRRGRPGRLRCSG